MKRLMAAAGCLALVSCDMAEAPPATAESPSAAPTSATPASDMAGTYEVTIDDGTVMTSALNADGTYVDTAAGEEAERGTWRSEGGETCFDPEGDEPEECHASSEPGADGSFKLLNEAGQEIGVTVRRVGDAPAPSEATPSPSATPAT